MLIFPIFVLSVKFYKEEKKLKLEVSKVFKKEKFLLNNKVYIFSISLIKKRKYIFWISIYIENIIQKLNNTTLIL